MDVHYSTQGTGTSALIVCHESTLSNIESEYITTLSQTVPYEPGKLYKRELPCIEAVLEFAPSLDLLIVDGYATLDPEGSPGLGAHTAAAIGIPVIGVAKTKFRRATHAIEVVRGLASRPLYVTTAGGIEITDGALVVAGMAGPNRIPSALARVDSLARRANLTYERNASGD